MTMYCILQLFEQRWAILLEPRNPWHDSQQLPLYLLQELNYALSQFDHQKAKQQWGQWAKQM